MVIQAYRNLKIANVEVKSVPAIFSQSGHGQSSSDVWETNRLEVHKAPACKSRVQVLPNDSVGQPLAEETCKWVLVGTCGFGFLLPAVGLLGAKGKAAIVFVLTCWFSTQVTHLFDNGGTVFFAIFMAIWGKYGFLWFVFLAHLTL